MEPVASGKKPLSPAKKKWIILAAVAAALVLFALWYTRPIPFQELIPGAELPPCQRIRVYADYSPNGRPRENESYEAEFAPGDPAYDQLRALFEEQSYSRSLWNLLPRPFIRYHYPNGTEQFQWWVILDYDADVTLPDGTIGGGSLLDFNNFYGTLDVDVAGGERWQANTRAMDQWLGEVMEVIRTHAALKE